MENQIVEAFGKYLVEINGSVVSFETQSAAEQALSDQLNGDRIAELTNQYSDHLLEDGELSAKTVVGRANIVSEFLSFAIAEGLVE